MQTIYQIDKNDLTEVISAIVRDAISNIPKPKEEPRLDRIDVDEVSVITGLKIPQIYKLTHRNEIPFKKFGKRLVFSRKEILQWVERQTKQPMKRTAVEEALSASAEARQRKVKHVQA